MTLLLNQICPEFDPNPELQEADRAQPLAIEPSDHFIMLSQQDCADDQTHFVLIERRDLDAFIEALKGC